MLSKLNKDISQLKASYEAIKKELAKETSEKESIARSINEKCSTLKKECDELKIKLEKTESSLKSSQTELSGSTRRMDNLTKMLRKYKQIVSDLKTENQNLIDNEQEAQKALAKEKRTVKILTDKNDLQTKQNGVDNRNQGVAANEADTQIVSTKKDTEDQTNKESANQVTGKNDGSANAASNVMVESARPENETLTEKVDLPAVPSGGFNFAPSKSVEKRPMNISEQNNVAKQENISPETLSKNSSVANSTTSAEEGRDSTAAEVPVTTEKTSDQLVKEENLRAKLMKRKRQLDAIMKKKAEEKEINAQQQAKRIDLGEKTNGKDSTTSTTDKSISDTKAVIPEDNQQSVEKAKIDETNQIKIENNSITSTSQTNEPSENSESKTKIEKTTIESSETAKLLGSKVGDMSQPKSETFLNLQPPGKGSIAPFVFGKSSNIQLPIPTAKVSQSPTMGVFAKIPFSNSNVESDSEQNKKRPLFSEEEKVSSKVARTEETKLDDKGLDKSKDSDVAEDGEIID